MLKLAMMFDIWDVMNKSMFCQWFATCDEYEPSDHDICNRRHVLGVPHESSSGVVSVNSSFRPFCSKTACSFLETTCSEHVSVYSPRRLAFGTSRSPQPLAASQGACASRSQPNLAQRPLAAAVGGQPCREGDLVVLKSRLCLFAEHTHTPLIMLVATTSAVVDRNRRRSWLFASLEAKSICWIT